MRAGSLAGRVALLTGANGGLGQAITDEFTARGATVFGVDLQGESCFHADVGTLAGNQSAIAQAIAVHGRLDILILNAGVQHLSPLSEFPDAEWERLLSVMLTGPFLAIKHAWEYLTRETGGRILATASTSSFVGERYKAAYVAAKHGILGLIKVAALEGAPHGLTANAVAPSWVRTPLVETQLADRAALHGVSEQDVIDDLVAEHAVNRFVEPEEVAALLGFLAEPAASAITGTCIAVDLGALAR